MTPASITRLMEFAQTGYPKEYAASDMMRDDLELAFKSIYKAGERHGRKQVEEIARRAIELRELLKQEGRAK